VSGVTVSRQRRAPVASRRRAAIGGSLWWKYAVLVVYAFFSLLPLIWMLSASFKSADQVLTVPVQWIPSEWHPENFERALFEPRFAGSPFVRFLVNSTVVAIATALASIALSLMIGYGFAKFRYRGRDALLWVVLGSTLLPFSSVVIPLYLIVANLGMIDSLLGLVVPFVVIGPAVFAARQFLLGIPTEYIEAARLDGASEWQVFTRLIVPLSGPAITTVAVLTFLFSWNMYLWPLVIMNSQENFTAPLGLSLLGLGATFTPDYDVWMAAAVLSTLPPLLFFLVLERPYMRGLEALSGLKG
jgi:ABC-type glycerol-3-phosphate transport system permease component